MASQLGAYTGGSDSSRRSGHGQRSAAAAAAKQLRSGHGQRSAAAAAAKQLLSRLVRSTWRQRSTARPRRRPAVNFGYDLQSYSKNFDDGLACSSGHPLSV